MNGFENSRWLRCIADKQHDVKLLIFCIDCDTLFRSFSHTVVTGYWSLTSLNIHVAEMISDNFHTIGLRLITGPPAIV